MKKFFKMKSIWIGIIVLLLIANLLRMANVRKSDIVLREDYTVLHVYGTDISIVVSKIEEVNKVEIYTLRNGIGIAEKYIYLDKDRVPRKTAFIDRDGYRCEVIDLNGDGIPGMMFKNHKIFYFIGGEFLESAGTSPSTVTNGREVELDCDIGRWRYVNNDQQPAPAENL